MRNSYFKIKNWEYRSFLKMSHISLLTTDFAQRHFKKKLKLLALSFKKKGILIAQLDPVGATVLYRLECPEFINVELQFKSSL